MPKSNHNAAHYFIETHLEAGRGEAIAFIEAASASVLATAHYQPIAVKLLVH